MISRLSAVIIILALFSTASFAADHGPDNRGLSGLQIRLNQSEQVIVQHTRDTLTETMALYLALHGDGETTKSRGVSRQLEEILKTDLRFTGTVVERFAHQVAQASADTSSLEIARPDDQLSLLDDRRSLRNARQLLRIKQRLTRNFFMSISFASRYRTLTDYVGVLDGQLQMSRLELADELEQ